MELEDVKDTEERAQFCLNNCRTREKANCFECERQVTLEEIIELCNEVMAYQEN